MFTQGVKSKVITYDANNQPIAYQLDDSVYVYVWSADGSNATKFASPPKTPNVPQELLTNSYQRLIANGRTVNCATIIGQASMFQPPNNVVFQEIPVTTTR